MLKISKLSLFKDQLAELHAFAKQNNLDIVEEFIEKRPAKIPGRPIFNTMLKKIEKGEANGILAWHPDRLARNSVDGGKIIYLIDCGRITTLKFPTFWFEPTPQGKFMLSIAFGQGKYYIDSLSENVRRGLRQKVRREEYPGPAPIGYLSDPRIKQVVVDKKKSKTIKAAFEFYAQGDKTLEDVSHFLTQQGITTKNGKVWHKDRVKYLLTNPFYYGHFRYAKEIHEGKHDPIITKKLFDRVQEVLKQRGRPRHKTKNEPQPFCGLLHCTCGMMITDEYKVKHQKNGNVHEYVYYHCSRKSKTNKCKEPCIRQEVLNKQISSLLQKVSLPKDWAVELSRLALQDHVKSAQSLTACVREKQDKISSLSQKLERLLNGYLDQIIDKEDYRLQKGKLLSEKKSLEEEIYNLSHKQNDWLEPFQNWLEVAQGLDKIASDSDLFAKKVCAKEIFGSNLLLGEKTLRACAPDSDSFLADSPVDSGRNSGGNHWDALRAAESVGQKSESLILVQLYDQIRTFFERN